MMAANDQTEPDIESISHRHCLALGRTSSEANRHIDHPETPSRRASTSQPSGPSETSSSQELARVLIFSEAGNGRQALSFLKQAGKEPCPIRGYHLPTHGQMCCWEYKPRHYCKYCSIPMYWAPPRGRVELCLSARTSGGGRPGRCVMQNVELREDRALFTACCADCARLVSQGVPRRHWRDGESVRRPSRWWGRATRWRP